MSQVLSASCAGPLMCVVSCSYKLRVECMLLCEESGAVLETLRPKAELLDRACKSPFKHAHTTACTHFNRHTQIDKHTQTHAHSHKHLCTHMLMYGHTVCTRTHTSAYRHTHINTYHPRQHTHVRALINRAGVCVLEL